MYILSYIKQGTGNKIFMLLRYIKIFKVFRKKNPSYWKKLYIVHDVSSHEKDLETEKLDYIFPKLKEIEWLEFISWKQYDTLKKDTKEFDDYKNDGPVLITPSSDWHYNVFTEQPTFLKTYLKFNSVYEPLLKKYDTKKGILIHYRLGDKFNINYMLLKRNRNPKYIICDPKYYIKHTEKMLEDTPDAPVYLASDSPKVAECLLKSSFPNLITISEDAEHTLFLMSKFKRMVINESTLPIVGGYLNSNVKEIIAIKYIRFDEKTNVGKRLFYFLDNLSYSPGGIFTLDSEKKYILKTIDQYEKIMTMCH
jgi:hypothetical protein